MKKYINAVVGIFWSLTVLSCQYDSGYTLFQEETLNEVNFVRTDPDGYAETRLKSYYDNGTDNGAYLDIKSYNSRESLELNEKLCRAAEDYAQYLADNNAWGHYENGTPSSRCQNAGYEYYSGENIAAGTHSYYNADESPQDAAIAFVLAWIIDEDVPSLGHRINMMSTGHTELGVGFARNTSSAYQNYAVQDFGSQ
jgi:hypothetical protein